LHQGAALDVGDAVAAGGGGELLHHAAPEKLRAVPLALARHVRVLGQRRHDLVEVGQCDRVVAGGVAGAGGDGQAHHVGGGAGEDVEQGVGDADDAAVGAGA